MLIFTIVNLANPAPTMPCTIIKQKLKEPHNILYLKKSFIVKLFNGEFFSCENKLFGFTHRLGAFIGLVPLQLARFKKFLSPKDAFSSIFVHYFYKTDSLDTFCPSAVHFVSLPLNILLTLYLNKNITKKIVL